MTNLVPAKSGKTPSYWCTWGTQNYSASYERTRNIGEGTMAGFQGSTLAQHSLDERSLFEQPGWAHQVLGKVRRDLFLILDQGWDVPYGTSDATEMLPLKHSVQILTVQYVQRLSDKLSSVEFTKSLAVCARLFC